MTSKSNKERPSPRHDLKKVLYVSNARSVDKLRLQHEGRPKELQNHAHQSYRRPKGLVGENRKISNPYGETWEKQIATTQPNETSLIYKTVPTCAYIVSIFYLPVLGREIFWIERITLVPAYHQPCFLPTLQTLDGDIYLAAPEPATVASTLPTSCADFASLVRYLFPPASCTGPDLYLLDCLLLFYRFPILIY